MIVVCIGYLLVAFVNMTMNAANWPIGHRGVWVMVCSIATGIGLFGLLINHETTDP